MRRDKGLSAHSLVKYLMPLPQVLEMVCSKCRVSGNCPAKGSSPLLNNGKMIAKCRLVGGYGRVELDKSILSPESNQISKKNGLCLTIAEVPKMENDMIIYDMVKIFSHPITHERESVPDLIGNIVPKSHA